MWRLLLCVVLLSCSTAVGGSWSKSVRVHLMSSWMETSLLAEASEFFAEESNESFWNFVEKCSEEFSTGSTNVTDASLYNFALSSSLEGTRKQLLRAALALRYYSPLVATHQQIAEEMRKQFQIPPDCSTWSFVDNTFICSLERLESFLEKNADSELIDPILLPKEHLYPSTVSSGRTVILFGQLGTLSFKQYHEKLKTLATEGKIRYIFRHFKLRGEGEKMLELQGYGAELALKSTEYKAVDDSSDNASGRSSQVDQEKVDADEVVEGFNFYKLIERRPQLKSELLTFRSHLRSLVDDRSLEEIKRWELKDLGFLAAQRIIQAADPLKVMKDLSQNFPSIAIGLSHTPNNETLNKHILENQKGNFAPGDNLVLINGRAITPETTNPFSLFDIIRKEASKVESLNSLQLPTETAINLVAQISAQSSTTSPDAPVRYRIQPPSSVVLFINNLEVDKRYQSWPSSIKSLLRPSFPGQLRYLRRNVVTAIAIIDPTSVDAQEYLAIVANYLMRNLPIRIGVVFYSSNEKGEDSADSESRLITKFCKYLHSKNPYLMLSFLAQLNPFTEEIVQLGTPKVTLERIIEILSELDPVLDVEQVLQSTELNEFIDNSNTWVENYLGVSTTNANLLPLLFVNGILANDLLKGRPVSGAALADSLISAAFREYPILINLLQQEELGEDSEVYSYFMQSSTTLATYHPLITLPGGTNIPHVSLAFPSTNISDADPTTPISLLASFVLSNLRYFAHPDSEGLVKPITHLIVVDLASIPGQRLLLQALRSLQTTGPSVRIGVVHYPSDHTDTSHLLPLLRAISSALSTQWLRRAFSFTLDLLHYSLSLADNGNQDLEEAKIFQIATNAKFKIEPFQAKFNNIEQHRKELALHNVFCHSFLKLSPNEHAIISNGRIIRIPQGMSFISEHFNLLEQYEYQKRTKSVAAIIEEASFVGINPDDITSHFRSDLVMKIVSLLGFDDQTQRVVLPKGAQSSFSIENENAVLSIEAVLDPLSKAAQRFVPMLIKWMEYFPIKTRVFLNPIPNLTKLPLITYYRYVFSDLSFDSDGKLSTVNSGATLNNLPSKKLLTLGMDTPENWLVQPIVARYDLDNIIMQDIVDDNLLAVFQLEHILLEGNCADLTEHGAPPRGLQLVLGTNPQSLVQDTIVMANLGYFQLKANPGLWYLRLSSGRASELYEMVERSSQGTKRIEYVPVFLSHFLGVFLNLKVQKRPGKEREQLLVVDGENNDVDPNLWQAFSGFFAEPSQDVGIDKIQEANKTHTGNQNGRIHIFSVASGHLYERFLKIMMLSVISHTKRPVTFWFLKNFLSPKFKDFIPHMAKHYGFDYKLVTYQWPSWLNKQTEKQRVIWGYKILFLDVLFPLNITKVIFVDADQVVRADLQELWEMNLHGAPLAYTPFCNSRREMDGFRFWSHGYWQDHLKGKPYHISALYVIDLARFRKLAAGDQMRATYEMLSQDPNSLANLDQDLPNYLQHHVAIHSLPQEWLWCETWCDEESKARAKTIDLCNNPMTKAPKLENAIRIVPEWTSYDNEIKELEQKITESAPSEQETVLIASMNEAAKAL